MKHMSDSPDAPKMTLDALQEAFIKAAAAKMEAEKRYNEKKDLLMNDLQKMLQKMLEKENDDLQKAIKDVAVAKQAIQEEQDRIRIASNKDHLPYPEGTILCLWEKRDRYQRWRPDLNPPMILSHLGHKAVVQLFRTGDPVPDGIREWKLPVHGDIVIRYLNKDGKPGKRFERWLYDDQKDCWLPEGVKHPRANT